MKTERLYLSTFEFNRSRVLEALRKSILKRGGSIVASHPNVVGDHTYIITNVNEIESKMAVVHHRSYIHFVLDGWCYYFQVDDNPFWKTLVRKSIVEHKCYSDVYSEGHELCEWMPEQGVYARSLTDEEISCAAERLLKHLTELDGWSFVAVSSHKQCRFDIIAQTK